LKVGCTYHLFKEGIRPEWEHSENRGGGKWVIVVPFNSNIDEMWEALLLSCIGETLSDSVAEICGVIVSIRKKQSKMSVWTKHSSPLVTEQMGAKLKQVLKLSNSIKYQLHSEAANSKNPKSLYTA